MSLTQMLIYEAVNATSKLFEKNQELNNELKIIDSNLTITESALNKEREIYKEAMKQSSNITQNHIQRLVEQC